MISQSCSLDLSPSVAVVSMVPEVVGGSRVCCCSVSNLADSCEGERGLEGGGLEEGGEGEREEGEGGKIIS